MAVATIKITLQIEGRTERILGRATFFVGLFDGEEEQHTAAGGAANAYNDARAMAETALIRNGWDRTLQLYAEYEEE